MLLALHSKVAYFAFSVLLSFLLPGSLGRAFGERVNSRATLPAPISVLPSQEWEGNDGPWSTFTLQIGTPPQNVKVLVSTASTQTWAVATEGCGAGDVTDCPKLRGGQYNYTASSSWVPNLANVSNQIYELGLESALGLKGNGRYGFDDITLGFQGSGGPTLKNQTVAGIAAKEFFMGVFGLTARPSNFTNYDNPIPSYMENLRNQSMIPSLSWAYTAGNQYRLNDVLGSLTLGGYDSSKFMPNNLTFDFPTNDDPDLTVKLEAITTSSSISLLQSSINTVLDSTVSHIWLPTSSCALFENAFGLTWNDTAQLYVVSETQHTLLQAQNPSVTFTLRRADTVSSATERVNITLPYGAFDLEASWPLVENSTRYFPLKRANDSSQYILGRAFFQEAYVIADYERKNFSVSQCKWDSSPQNIVTIFPPSNSTDNPKSETSGLPTGAIAGIAAGGGALLIVLAVVLYFCWWRPRQRKRKTAELAANEVTIQNQQQQQQQQEFVKPELDSNEVNQKPGLQIHETEGSKVFAPVEIGNPDIVYEMPAREEVASEMTGTSTRGDEIDDDRFLYGGRGFRRGDRTPASATASRQSSISSGWGSPRSMHSELARGRGRGSFNEASPGTDTLSSVSSGWGSTNRTLGSDNVSPASPGHIQREQRRSGLRHQ
ncbi:aspartic peptidase domain-containing protein [Leptodontidium sp. 2 PMI_412]|nr:aspartic peptidase domain-containing protein [Leptodontidium sp. 2 PMI_412]